MYVLWSLLALILFVSVRCRPNQVRRGCRELGDEDMKSSDLWERRIEQNIVLSTEHFTIPPKCLVFYSPGQIRAACIARSLLDS